MNQHRFYTLLYIIACVSSLLTAQPIVFNQYLASDGLSDNNVLCGLRDHYGFMWLGTNNGLNCFDGMQNMVFRNMVEENASFENNTITSLYEHEQDIWFGGSFGLYVYHRNSNSFSRFNKRTKYGVSISSTVQDIAASQNGLIWIGTQGQGVFIYDPKTDELTQDSRHGAFISDIFTESDSPVFLATLQGQILLYSQTGDYQKQYAIPDYVPDKNNLCITNINHRIYIGSEHGLYTIHQGDSHIERVSGIDGGIHALSTMGSDLLIGAEHGLYRYQPEKGQLTHFHHVTDENENIEDFRVNALLWDNDSTLWVLTQMGGVYYFPASHSGVQVSELPGTAQGRMIRAVCETPDGNLWIGSDSGLYFYDQQTKRISQHTGPGLQQEINSLMLDGDDLWIGTSHDGIIVLNTLTGNRHHYQYSANHSYTIPTNEITSLLCTSQGTIYVGTSWGLCRFDRKTENFMWYFGIGSQTNVTCLAEDRQGCVWVATGNHGLFRQNSPGGDFRNYTYHHNQPQSISSNDISTVFCDHEGTVWVALNGGGLCRYQPDKDGFESFGSNIAVLQGQQVYFITEDQHNNLWLGMETGLLKINAERDAEQAQLLRSYENFVRKQKPHNSAIITRSGELFVGRYNVLAHFMTDHITFTKDRNPVYIISLTLPYQQTDDKDKKAARYHWPFNDGNITLHYADNDFTLHFSAPQFTGNTSDLRFEYMLEGIDKTWAHGTKNAEATYVNVPPGQYTFLLRKAGNTDAEAYARLQITILPPWYRTTLAYIIYALLFVVSVFYAVRRYSRQVRRRYDRRMKDYQAQQEKANFESKIRFFVDLVHEIRTPLSLISLPLESIEDGLEQNENGGLSKIKEHTSAIRRNMNYLLGITNQLLDFQKADSGNLQLNLKNCDIAQLLTNVYQQFADAMEVQGKQLQLQLPDQPVNTAVDVDKVQKVLMNLVGNAMKYARSEIILRLEQQSLDKLCISVIDDGPGVPENERDKIFDLYYQIGNDSGAATLGTGLGLSYAKRLAQAHHGDLLLNEAVGGGSNFQLVLPIEEVASLPSPERETIVSAPKTTEAPSGTAEGASMTNHRILLVEDNEELLQMTTEALRPHFRILKAHDGQEALDVLQYNDVDVIVSDVMMPRMDGNELCRRVKTDINYSHIPVILLTAKTSVEAKVEGMQSGADVYLEKPFSAKQLHLQITSLLRMRQQFHERMRQIDGAAPTSSSEGSFGLNQQDLQFMERLQQMVTENMRDEEFSIDLLAEQMNMSRSSFYRKIKALTDMTPIEYLKTRRLDQAALLLRQGIRITEVAERVGFTSSSYFAKCFKAKFGCLPKDYVSGEG